MVENDETQEITFFSSTDVPVAVGLVVDNSSSMIARRRMVLAGGIGRSESSHPEDELFAVVFNETSDAGCRRACHSRRDNRSCTAALDRFPPVEDRHIRRGHRSARSH